MLCSYSSTVYCIVSHLTAVALTLCALILKLSSQSAFDTPENAIISKYSDWRMKMPIYETLEEHQKYHQKYRPKMTKKYRLDIRTVAIFCLKSIGDFSGYTKKLLSLISL